MAAREGGGGGALGWTVLGFLAGVAATLAVQTLVGGGRDRVSIPEAGVPHATTTIQGDVAPPRSSVLPAKAVAAASSQSAAAPVAIQPRDEVADDAAAAGMTSRVRPQGDEGGSRN